jgi:hypothetical protein
MQKQTAEQRITAVLMTSVGQWLSSDDPTGQLFTSSQRAVRCSCEEAGSRKQMSPDMQMIHVKSENPQ